MVGWRITHPGSRTSILQGILMHVSMACQRWHYFTWECTRMASTHCPAWGPQWLATDTTRTEYGTLETPLAFPDAVGLSFSSIIKLEFCRFSSSCLASIAQLLRSPGLTLKGIEISKQANHPHDNDSPSLTPQSADWFPGLDLVHHSLWLSLSSRVDSCYNALLPKQQSFTTTCWHFRFCTSKALMSRGIRLSRKQTKSTKPWISCWLSKRKILLWDWFFIPVSHFHAWDLIVQNFTLDPLKSGSPFSREENIHPALQRKR